MVELHGLILRRNVLTQGKDDRRRYDLCGLQTDHNWQLKSQLILVMAHRSVLDLFLGRHYCPACGKRAGFRDDLTYDKKKIRWYRLAPVRHFCSACGVEVRAVIGRGVWVVLPVVLIAMLGCVFVIDIWTGRGILTRSAAHVADITLLVILLLVGACVIQAFWRYEVVSHAP